MSSRRVKRRRTAVDYAKMAKGDFGDEEDEELRDLFREDGEDDVIDDARGADESEAGDGEEEEGVRRGKRRQVEELVRRVRAPNGTARERKRPKRYGEDSDDEQDEGREAEDEEGKRPKGGAERRGAGDGGIPPPSPRKGVRGQRSRGAARWQDQSESLKEGKRPGASVGMYRDGELDKEKEKEAKAKKRKQRLVMSDDEDEELYGLDADESEDFVPIKRGKRGGEDEGELSDDEVLDPEGEEGGGEEEEEEDRQELRKRRQERQVLGGEKGDSGSNPNSKFVLKRAQSNIQQKVLGNAPLSRSASGSIGVSRCKLISHSTVPTPRAAPSPRGPAAMKGTPGRLLSKIGYKVPLVAAAAKQGALAKPVVPAVGRCGKEGGTEKAKGGGTGSESAKGKKESVVLRPWRPSTQSLGVGSGRWEKKELVALLDDSAILTPPTPKPAAAALVSGGEQGQGELSVEVVEGDKDREGDRVRMDGLALCREPQGGAVPAAVQGEEQGQSQSPRAVSFGVPEPRDAPLHGAHVVSESAPESSCVWNGTGSGIWVAEEGELPVEPSAHSQLAAVLYDPF